LFQKSGADARVSILASSSAGLAASKITPEIRGAFHEVLILPDEFIDCESHESLQKS
jgi:hypothetical protein